MITVLFETQHLYYLPQFRPVIEELKNRGGYAVSLSMPTTVDPWEQVLLEKASANLQVEFITAGSEDDRVTRLRDRGFDVIVVGNVGKLEDIATDPAVTVMIYHGIGLKWSYYRDTVPRVDIRAVESESRFRDLKVQGADNLALVGFTKLDPISRLMKSHPGPNLEDWGLDPSRRTVLYAPTFYPSSLEKVLPFLPVLARKANVIIKLHNFSWFKHRFEHQSRKAENVARGNAGICLLPKEEYNILPFYVASDALISDISSTLFEYLALNRPIIQTHFFSLKLKHRLFPSRLAKKLDSLRAREVDFTHPLARPEDLVRVTEEALEDPHNLEEARRVARDRYLYRIDGRASSRLVDTVETRLRESGRKAA
ncbi:MAG: CDP-glycerol glycerophosphotransferase family protein [Fidelibacterota bacterium]